MLDYSYGLYNHLQRQHSLMMTQAAQRSLGRGRGLGRQEPGKRTTYTPSSTNDNELLLLGRTHSTDLVGRSLSRRAIAASVGSSFRNVFFVIIHLDSCDSQVLATTSFFLFQATKVNAMVWHTINVSFRVGKCIMNEESGCEDCNGCEKSQGRCGRVEYIRMTGRKGAKGLLGSRSRTEVSRIRERGR